MKIMRSNTMRSRNGFAPALLPSMSILMVASALVVSLVGGTSGVAVPVAGASTSAAGNAASAPQAWVAPVNVSGNPRYDNTSSIGAAPNGAVTVGWEQRDIAPAYSDDTIMQGSNTSLGGTFHVDELLGSDYKQSGNVKVAGD